MLLFALISEIPFDLAFSRTGAFPDFNHQNIYFELLLGLITFELMYKGKKKNIFRKLIIMFVSTSIASALNFDYSSFGILLMVLLYEHKNEPLIQLIAGYGLCFLSSADEKYGLLSLIPICLYNGKQINNDKKLSKPIKLGFYLYYPLHILVLYLIKQYL